MDYNQLALQEYERLHGLIGVSPRAVATDLRALSTYYTPGVGAVARAIADNDSRFRDLTWTKNAVAVISDGSAVLGLGNIGPKAALPVMEGKSMLFKHFAGIDAVPIVIDVHTPDEIVAAVKAIAPSFGGINLEDIGSPICFEVEERLKDELSIPVMHDDQHGTAIVVLAGLINALKVVDKPLGECRVVLIGAGAAGVATAKLLEKYANPEIITVDSQGVILANRPDLTPEKQYLASLNLMLPDNDYTLKDALLGADIVIGVSKGNALSADDIKIMNDHAIVFAMANPEPEIMPDVARAAGAAVVATGRSDFPNQINNVLAFPGIFRGALDNNVSHITDEHKIDAAKAIAELVEQPTSDLIIPSPLDPRVMPAVASVIR